MKPSVSHSLLGDGVERTVARSSSLGHLDGVLFGAAKWTVAGLAFAAVGGKNQPGFVDGTGVKVDGADSGKEDGAADGAPLDSQAATDRTANFKASMPRPLY